MIFKILSGFFGISAAITTGGITLLLVIDGGAKQLGEQFGRTPYWLYATLVAGVAVFSFLAWFASQAEWKEPAVLPPNPPEPEEEESGGWHPNLLASNEEAELYGNVIKLEDEFLL
ncbi:MAG: hypothetical protein WC745_00520 [Patescibacteria group bacterium]|jgi:hypothetical protein